MKKAFLYKLTLLLTVFALAFTAFAFTGIKTAHAAVSEIKIDSVTDYFNADGATLNADGTNLIATVSNNGTVGFENELTVNNLAIELSVSDSVKMFTVSLTSNAYAVGGVVEEENSAKPNTTVVNEFTVDVAGDKIYLNGDTNSAEISVTQNLTVKFSTVSGVLSATLLNENGDEVTVSNDANDLYHKIAGNDKNAASVSFAFELVNEDGSAEVAFKSVNQGEGDDYKQTFAANYEDKIAVIAKPRVSITSVSAKVEDGVIVPVYGYKYSFSFAVYSVFGNLSASDLYLSASDENVKLENKATPKAAAFYNEETTTLVVRSGFVSDIETYQVATAANRDSDNDAPTYISYAENQEIYENYDKLVKLAALNDYDNGTFSIRLGDEYTVPSLENLVTDNLDAYASLTYTVYYRTPSQSSGSTSSMKFTVSEAGDYTFYVVFKDKNGNAMDKDDFFTVSEEDSNVINKGSLYHAVFTFNVQDDAPISVTAPTSQGDGYLNTRYTATGFKIQSSGNNVSYTLYYNGLVKANAEDEGWVKIPELSDVKEDYSENGFTYSDIEAINYDGKYTFTPIKIGAYKIVCFVTSDNSVRYDSASTIIEVKTARTEVKVDTHWLQNNIWSVVFLSIGTLALIGIIVLLCIKPKETVETDATGDALKNRK